MPLTDRVARRRGNPLAAAIAGAAAISVLAAAAGGSATRVDAAAKARIEVLGMERSFSARSAAVGAPRAWREYFDPREGHLFGPTGEPAVGSAAIFAAMGGDAPPPATITLKTERIWVAKAGDMATTWGRWTSRRPGGTGRSGRYVTTWRRNGGGAWKVLVDIGNSDRVAAGG
ncbi:MAG TPA: nuclear transport factor 2 family protein [Allosphingosinicella sp.]|jgi:ketosteroid isomerase-like protein